MSSGSELFRVSRPAINAKMCQKVPTQKETAKKIFQNTHVAFNVSIFGRLEISKETRFLKKAKAAQKKSAQSDQCLCVLLGHLPTAWYAAQADFSSVSHGSLEG